MNSIHSVDLDELEQKIQRWSCALTNATVKNWQFTVTTSKRTENWSGVFMGETFWKKTTRALLDENSPHSVKTRTEAFDETINYVVARAQNDDWQEGIMVFYIANESRRRRFDYDKLLEYIFDVYEFNLTNRLSIRSAIESELKDHLISKDAPPKHKM